jgi:S1-C subfamily serine protease
VRRALGQLDLVEKAALLVSAALVLTFFLDVASRSGEESSAIQIHEDLDLLYQQPESFAQVAELMEKTVFEVSCGGNFSGSAWSIEMDESGGLEGSFMVTNFHVIDECLEGQELSVTNAKHTNLPVMVLSYDGTYWSDKDVHSDSFVDLALLRTPQTLPGLKLSRIAPKLGHWALIAGYPSDSGGNPIRSLSTGTITGIDRYGLVMTDAPINRGNSGGPLVNSRGEVFVTVFSTEDLSKFENMGFAQPLNYHCEVVFRCEGAYPPLKIMVPSSFTFEK